jgi:hypothetical protein
MYHLDVVKRNVKPSLRSDETTTMTVAAAVVVTTATTAAIERVDSYQTR